MFYDSTADSPLKIRSQDFDVRLMSHLFSRGFIEASMEFAAPSPARHGDCIAAIAITTRPRLF
jgi:hypothetical protein